MTPDTAPIVGSQARDFWRDLDLGTPELAATVMEEFDYYLVFNVAEDVEQQVIEDAAFRYIGIALELNAAHVICP